MSQIVLDDTDKTLVDQLRVHIEFFSDKLEELDQVSVPHRIRIALFQRLLRHYHKHADAYDVEIRSIDVYKVFAWIPFILCRELSESEDSIEYDWNQTYEVSVTLLLYELEKNSDARITPQWIRKLKKMIMMAEDERVDPECESISISKNGLYTAFKTTSVAFQPVHLRMAGKFRWLTEAFIRNPKWTKIIQAVFWFAGAALTIFKAYEIFST